MLSALAGQSDHTTYDARWSPDGRFLAFDVNTSHCDVADTCHGSGSWWVVNADAHDIGTVVTGVKHPQATALPRRFASGNVTPLLGVELLAWTP